MPTSRRSRSPARSPAPKPTPPTKSPVAAKTTTNTNATTNNNLRVQFVLLLAVFLDMVGVALVVPNLTFFWKDVGITPAGLGLVSSIYSMSQLIGGLVIGRLGDRQLSRKSLLLLSFAGSGLSYMLVGMATNVETLVVSRIVVGLVKQTQTTTFALMSRLSSEDTRAQALGRISSASTLAMVVGQSLGGALSSHYGRRTPCFVASFMFVLAFALVVACLPRDMPVGAAAGGAAAAAKKDKASTKSSTSSTSSSWSLGATLRERAASLTSTFASAFKSPSARHILAIRAAYGFLMRGGYTLHSLYEKERWDLTPATAGYLSTYKTALALAVNSLLVGLLAKRFGDAELLLLSNVLSGANAALEAAHSTFWVYAFVNLPLSSMLGTLTRTTLSSIFSKAVPTSEAGSALSFLDVVNSAIGVIAPLYGGLLLDKLGVRMQPLVSLGHYVLLFMLGAALLERKGVSGAPSSSVAKATKKVKAE